MSSTWGQEYVLSFSCPEKPGIVHAVSGFLVQHSANILASQQYGEAPDGRFFMRVHFAAEHRVLLNGARTVVFHLRRPRARRLAGLACRGTGPA
jgi:formyltetrahydrofolate hydrolase